ncbi:MULTISPECIES: Crp/Fnr family transcriptional regulator [Nitrosomonas]|uniref:CRP-like cAMP-binding protein n=1 Tax=Nitrosomonas communis TaxID=44574 RepID=A0A0F7KD46_9PROT|nr:MULTISPECIES: Crp/Fnr family transcriptional regulator [Nitrosomonas]AKH36632.1 Crp/Fnr family transcriptional regulator [Nitrosomonas communis]TYP90996.1 CRP-like cAMP-binding protein [Nitrosomonas communis]UVS61666.1 Crp/Fnr family transcriptional regulator [Nitrosomonas sp. PLL12]
MSSSKHDHIKAEFLNPLLEQNLQQWKQICPSIQEIEIPDKHFLYRQGESCASLFWIKEGIVKLSYLTIQGNELTLALIKSGGITGQLQQDCANPVMQESAQALGRVSFYRIEYEDFKKLIYRWPEWSWAVFETMSNRQQQIERKLRTILTQPVGKRVVATLLDLAQLFGTRCKHGYSLEVFLTQQELADLVGASRSVVSTIMNEFRNRGLLDYTREQICINDAALINEQSFD